MLGKLSLEIPIQSMHSTCGLSFPNQSRESCEVLGYSLCRLLLSCIFPSGLLPSPAVSELERTGGPAGTDQVVVLGVQWESLVT